MCDRKFAKQRDFHLFLFSLRNKVKFFPTNSSIKCKEKMKTSSCHNHLKRVRKEKIKEEDNDEKQTLRK